MSGFLGDLAEQYNICCNQWRSDVSWYVFQALLFRDKCDCHCPRELAVRRE